MCGGGGGGGWWWVVVVVGAIRISSACFLCMYNLGNTGIFGGHHRCPQNPAEICRKRGIFITDYLVISMSTQNTQKQSYNELGIKLQSAQVFHCNVTSVCPFYWDVL